MIGVLRKNPSDALNVLGSGLVGCVDRANTSYRTSSRSSSPDIASRLAKRS